MNPIPGKLYKLYHNFLINFYYKNQHVKYNDFNKLLYNNEPFIFLESGIITKEFVGKINHGSSLEEDYSFVTKSHPGFKVILNDQIVWLQTVPGNELKINLIN